MTDWGELYQQHVAAVEALAGDLTDDQLATPVPATPAWTVHDVLAHLAGAASDAATDAATGRMDGASSPEWTARHVGERRGRPVADLLAELRSHQDAVAEQASGSARSTIVWDAAVHHADLHEALDRGVLPDHLWQPVLAGVAATKLSTGIPEEVDHYELFRALFSRRSRTQMQAWGLPLSAEQLDELCLFGPREDDQPVPA